MNPYAKAEILETMQTHAVTFTEYLGSLTPEQFFAGTLEKWGAALQTQHLTQTLGMIARALSVPERLPPAPITQARRFAEIKAAYTEALGGGVTLLGHMLPALEPRADAAYQQEVIANFRQMVATFSSNLEAWSEEQLDTLGMKHPLMGLLPTREMAIFAIYHNIHHENGIKKFLDANPA
ncbi:MAG: DinB family protein [Deinococcales bacterium]